KSVNGPVKPDSPSDLAKHTREHPVTRIVIWMIGDELFFGHGQRGNVFSRIAAKTRPASTHDLHRRQPQPALCVIAHHVWIDDSYVVLVGKRQPLSLRNRAACNFDHAT